MLVQSGHHHVLYKADIRIGLVQSGHHHIISSCWSSTKWTSSLSIQSGHQDNGLVQSGHHHIISVQK